MPARATRQNGERSKGERRYTRGGAGVASPSAANVANAAIAKAATDKRAISAFGIFPNKRPQKLTVKGKKSAGGPKAGSSTEKDCAYCDIC